MSILYISEVLHLNIIYYNASSHRCTVVNTSVNCEMMTEIPCSIDTAKLSSKRMLIVIDKGYPPRY